MMFMLLFLKAGMLPILHRSVSQSVNRKRSLVTHYSQVGYSYDESRRYRSANQEHAT